MYKTVGNKAYEICTKYENLPPDLPKGTKVMAKHICWDESDNTWSLQTYDSYSLLMDIDDPDVCKVPANHIIPFPIFNPETPNNYNGSEHDYGMKGAALYTPPIDKIKTKISSCKGEVNKYIEAFHNESPAKRAEIINKIKAKYDSDEYRNREILKYHREPITYLYWVLFEYAQKYGKQLPQEKNNPFPHEVYIIDNAFVIRLMHGQGSCVDVWSLSEYNTLSIKPLEYYEKKVL